MRPYRWTPILVLLSLLLGAYPAVAEVRPIDPAQPPPPVLEPAEREKLAALLKWTLPVFMSEVSPDDRSILIAHFRLGPELHGAPPTMEFLNVQDGMRIPVDERARTVPPSTNVAWRNARTAIYVSGDERDGTLLVALDSITGAVVTTPLPLPGIPLSLAPNASRLLLMLPIGDERISAQARTQWRSGMAGMRTMDTLPSLLPVPVTRKSSQLASEEFTLAVFDLTSQELVPLGRLSEESSLKGTPAWTPDGSKLALVRMRGRGAASSVEDLAIQDALGKLPPSENPFLQSNVVDVFDLANGTFQPAALRAATGDGWLYSNAAWSPDGQTLMTQLKHPVELADRRYPIYQYADRVSVGFYNNALEPVERVDRPELGGPQWSFSRWLSPDELLFYAPSGMHWRLHYYNRVSGEFRQLPLPEGTYHHVPPDPSIPHQVQATRRSRQLIFVHSSFLQPYEIYRANWDGSGLKLLTQLNDQVAAVNKLRADQVSFKMKGGALRTGYLLQPADAAFPPQNVPIVVWQQGGPGDPMTSEWGGSVKSPFNLLPNFGIALLVLPLPGREGYGPEFYNKLVDGRNFGAIDIDEGVQAVEQMIKRGWTSRGHVGITGCSYGGYYTAQSITRHPHVYAAANPQCSLLDLMWLWEAGDKVDAAFLMGRVPTDAPSKEYIKDSPIHNATKVRTPLLIFHGTEDFLPVETAAEFHNKVAATGTPVELLTFEGERHALALLSSNLIAGQAQIAWFRQYLQAAPKPPQSPKSDALDAPMRFPETGYSLDGAFRQFWQIHGGLPVFGYPLESARTVDGQPQQPGTVPRLACEAWS